MLVFRDYIAIGQNNERQDLSRDNNDDRLNNHTDQVHARIELEDILYLVYIHLTMEVEVVHRLEYKTMGMLYHVPSMVYYRLLRSKVRELHSSPDLHGHFNEKLNQSTEENVQSDCTGQTHILSFCDQKRLFIHVFVCGTPRKSIEFSVRSFVDS